jgi:hypothetical protein
MARNAAFVRGCLHHHFFDAARLQKHEVPIAKDAAIAHSAGDVNPAIPKDGAFGLGHWDIFARL